MNEKNNKWHILITPIAGLALGFEILTDDDDRMSFGLQLFILRILFTRSDWWFTGDNEK